MGAQLNVCESSGSARRCPTGENDPNCFDFEVGFRDKLTYVCWAGDPAPHEDSRVEPTFSRASDARLQAFLDGMPLDGLMQEQIAKHNVLTPERQRYTAETPYEESGMATAEYHDLGPLDARDLVAAQNSKEPLSSFKKVFASTHIKTGKSSAVSQDKKRPKSTSPKNGVINVAKSSSDSMDVDDDTNVDPEQRELHRQRKLGAQSKRGAAPWFQIDVLDHHPHCRDCFKVFEKNEEEMCGEWAAFYHSYNTGALIYELNTVLFNYLFPVVSSAEVAAPMPRLLVHEFAGTPNAASLKEKFETVFSAGESAKCDHEPAFRAVAISAMCSIVALGPEASTPVVFVGGYSHADNPVDFRKTVVDLLYSLVVSHHCPGKNDSWLSSAKSKTKKLKIAINTLVDKIIALAEKHHLDVSGFGGKPCPTGKSGHILQINIKREFVDVLSYASEPWGVPDAEREPLSKWLGEDTNTNWGQARILAHPEMFMKETCVRTYVASAEPLFHNSRAIFVSELTKLIREELLPNEALQACAAAAIYGGMLPAGWKAPASK